MTTTAHEISDAALKAMVIEELRYTPDVDSAHIGVSVSQGTITLSGEVSTYPEQEVACRAAQRVRGVTALAQEIEVRSIIGMHDLDIARDAARALELAVNVPDTVKASVTDRRITLTGTTEWEHERAAAARTVGRLRGVRAVINLVTLLPTAAAHDIKATITAGLIRNAQVEAQHLTVIGNAEGVVTVAGPVRSWAERRQIEKICWSAPGVTKVIDELTVSP